MTLLRKKRPVWVGLSGGNLPIPAALVAPAIAVDAVIGTAQTVTPGTWNVAGTLTYQWQVNTGSWVDIVGATVRDRPPVDAQFGYSIRVAETNTNAAGVATTAYSNATNLVKEALAQTFTDKTGNVNLNWSGGAVAGNWLLNGGTVGGNPGISEVAPDGSAGQGAIRFLSNTNNVPQLRLPGGAAGQYHNIHLKCTARTSGAIRLTDFNSGQGVVLTGVAEGRALQRLSGTTYGLITSTQPTDIVADYASDDLITLNAQLTAPSANMWLSAFYELPGTPVNGTQVWVITRISGSQETDGNYGLILLLYNGTQWDITVHIVSAHNPGAAIITANDIGITNGIKISLNGNSWTVYTTANKGTSWDLRGTATNATYNTATGVNAMWTDDVTIGQLVVANFT